MDYKYVTDYFDKFLIDVIMHYLQDFKQFKAIISLQITIPILPKSLSREQF